MAKGKRKNFSGEIESLVQEPIQEAGGGAADIFNGIPISGDDLLADMVTTISDRTVEPARPETVQVVSNIPKEEASLPEVAGEESPVDPEFIKRVEETRAAHPDKALEEIERLVKLSPIQSPESGGANTPFQPSVNTPFDSAAQQPIDEEANRIGAQEIVDWYDMGQQLLSVFGYEYFSSPKESNAIVASLMPKVMANTASQAERSQFEQAQKVLLSYTERKTRFSETVAMSQDLKERTIRLLEKVLAHRGIQLSPEMLLGVLFLTPLIINGGRILLEKMGFGNADEMVGKFNAFVKTQESNYYQNNQ